MPGPSVNSFPNKLPPEFVERTLARMLPPQHEIDGLSELGLRKLASNIAEIRQVIKKEPVRYYAPNPGGQTQFMTLNDPTVRALLFVAGNKTGKTTAGAVKMAEYMCGEALWGGTARAPVEFKTPAYGCVFAEDFDSHKEVTLPAYLTWCPRRFIKDVKHNPAGAVVHIEHHNGSFLFFRTYDQGSDKAEGKDWDVVWDDEPPPRSIYTAQLRGLVTRNGLLIVTATLLKEAWLFDEAEGRDFIRLFGSSIFENPWLNEQARNDFIASLSDDERSVRIDGKPVSLVGVVYKEFRDGPPFIIPNQEFQNDWPIIMGVDPHERKPLYCLWGVITPSNTIIFFDCLNPTGSLDEIEQMIRAREAMHHNTAAIVVMDPNRGRARQLDGRCWQDVFEGWGYSVELGRDNLRLGHTMVHTYLQAHRFRFTENLRGKSEQGIPGPVHAMLRYAWSDWATGHAGDLKEKPAEAYKDYPDIIRYIAMAELDFDILKYGPKVIDRMQMAQRPRWGIRAGL